MTDLVNRCLAQSNERAAEWIAAKTRLDLLEAALKRIADENHPEAAINFRDAIKIASDALAGKS